MLIPLLADGRKPVLLVITLCCIFGFAVQLRGVMSRDVHAWNGTPVNVNDQLDRLWDWQDMQMLRGLGK